MSDPTAQNPFDPSLYTRAPGLSILSGMSLAQALCAVSPPSPSAPIKKAYQKLEKVRLAAQAAWASRQRALGPKESEASRQVDALADRAWAALRDRLAAYASLPKADFPKAARAQELHDSLFPQGLAFTQITYAEQLAAMDAMLKRIDDEKMAKDLDALAGSDFLANVRNIHPRYTAMVSASLTSDNMAPLTPHVRAMAQAIVELATKLCAQVDSDDPTTVEPVLTALAPIRQFRDHAARMLKTHGGETPMPEETLDPPSGDSEG